MKRLLMTLGAVLAGAAVWAQETVVTPEERQRASLAILAMVLGGLLLIYGLMWLLRRTGRLPEEKPIERARWVHPEDDK